MSHVAAPDELLASLEASPGGLTSDEAARRLAEHGPNVLPQRPPPSRLAIFARQFRSPLIFILVLAAGVSIALGEHTDAGFIAAVVLLNAIIGGLQEWKAEQSSRALQKLLRTRATVLRDGELREIDGEQIVVGDVVALESGNRVAADLRLLTDQGLEIDESLLTGESLPVAKDSTWRGDETAPVADRRNMAWAGSIVVRGRGRGLVCATASETEVGKLAREVTGSPGGKPPLLVRLERFTKVIGVAVLVAAALVAALGVVVMGQSISDMFMFAVALAVSAIPEGLPVTLTVALAIATTRMARRGVIVRKLAAVEGLGSCTLIATDKTGTLTCNELTVRRLVLPDGTELEVTGEGYTPGGEILREGAPVARGQVAELDRLCLAAVLCNEGQLSARGDGWVWLGDPTDVALLAAGHKLGWVQREVLETHPLVSSIPFEAERKYAATFHRAGDGIEVFAKGAPERILAMCDFADPEAPERLAETAAGLGSRGFRVLGLAAGAAAEPPASGTPEEPSGLTFLGFSAMIDPLRPGVRDAIATCHEAGIAVTMITGDHPVTALAIARELGFADDPAQVVSGQGLPEASSQELAALVATTRVFARVSPQQKLDIVHAARAAGHMVAVTGDGVNDAPALRAANIGVAMGKAGTDVAREAADLVISDDNFATIVAGVEEGRLAYDNIRKVIFLLVSTGAAEVVLVTLSLLAGLPLPLLPVQILWLNLVTNGIQDKALAFEPADRDIITRPPRPPQERIFNRLMLERTLLSALVMGVVACGAFWWMLEAGWAETEARNATLFLMVLFENVQLGNARSETRSIFRLSPLKSPLLLGGAVLAFGVHLGAMHLPAAQRVLGTEPVSWQTWLALGCLALTLTVAVELHKLWWARRQRRC